MTRKWQNSATRRRTYARFRAHLVRLLGWAPEDTTCAAGRYAATTGEMLRWAREERAKKGSK